MLTEWWTYRPHDFLMFSPRIYWRLMESINAAWWPLAVWFAAAALPIFVLAVVGSFGEPRAGAGTAAWRVAAARLRRALPAPLLPLGLPLLLVLLAAAWAFVACAFLWQRFAPIFWAVEAAVWAFALQALGWLLLGGQLMRMTAQGRGWQASAEPRRLLMGGLMSAAALLVYPLLPLLPALAERPWQQAELFGLAPDPTVLFSLGVLVLLPAPASAGAPLRLLARTLWIVPLAWCLFSSTTLALLGSWQAPLPISAALLALWAHRRRGP